MTVNIIDQPIPMTFFTGPGAQTATRKTTTLRDLSRLIEDTSAPSKSDLPWLKLATFGDKRTAKNSLRHNANMTDVWGVELDYDDKTVTPGEAARRLKHHGIAALVYTSPSHTLEAPKWRVLAPLSQRHPPDARLELAGRLNTAIGSIAAGESFTASQAFYYGETPQGDDHHTILIPGKPLDDCKLAPTYPARKTAEPLALPPRTDDQSTTEYALTVLARSCERFATPDAAERRHHVMLSVTFAIAPFVLGGFLDYDTATETIRAELGRPANDGEIENALDGALSRSVAYVPATGAEFAEDPPPDLPPEPENPTAWRSMLQRGEGSKTNPEGAIKGNLLNASLAVRKAPAWRGVVRLNTFANKVMFCKPPPWWDKPRSAFVPFEARDVDGTRAAVWLQSEGIQVPPQTAGWAMADAAERDQYHPVRDYLDALAWDGVARADAWLVDHLGAEDTPLNRAFGAKFLLSMVARVRKPGCKVDTVLILEGRQGLKKSSALHAMSCGWFTDHMPDLANKDAAIQTHGVWLVEFAELDKLHRAEAAKAKAFISTATDRLRMPFGRCAEDHPRQCVFAGTVNPGAMGYLQDETGNRRFWPVACGVGWPAERQVDLPAISGARDQIWAEINARFMAGEAWWIDTETLEQGQHTAAETRRTMDVWAPLVAQYVADKSDVSVGEIMRGALGMAAERWTPGDAQRVGRILTVMRLERRQVRVGHWRDNTREIRYFTGNTVVDMAAHTTDATQRHGVLENMVT